MLGVAAGGRPERDCEGARPGRANRTGRIFPGSAGWS